MKGLVFGWMKVIMQGRMLMMLPLVNYPPNLSFAIEEMEKEHVIEEEDYMIDEHDSGEDEDSCENKPVVIRFNE